MKRCCHCKETKPEDEFGIHTGSPDGRRSTCRECRVTSGELARTTELAKRRREETFQSRHPERRSKFCATCGVLFTPRRRGGTTQKYCSETCRAKHDNAVRMKRHPDRILAWWDAHPDYGMERRRQEKRDLFQRYGGAKCSRCGEEEIDFLTIDHIGGGGARHRREIGTNIYKWLRENNYPVGFRVLCMNCNWATRHGRPCPHTTKIGECNVA